MDDEAANKMLLIKDIITCQFASNRWSTGSVQGPRGPAASRLNGVRAGRSHAWYSATFNNLPVHHKQYETYKMMAGPNVIVPRTCLHIGQKHTVKGGRKDYVMKRKEDSYTCTCPSWRNAGLPEKERSCTHLRTLLGDEYEAARIRAAKVHSPSKSLGKRKSVEQDDPDVFPYLPDGGQHATQRAKLGRKFSNDFNDRQNGGPRDLNGGSPLLLALKWNEERDPTGYWLSEKLDGVRAWWNGTRMFSRTGRAWNPPTWFIAKMPSDLHLDGELWMKRDAFDATSGICRRSDPEGWSHVNFMVFDITNISLLYEDRLKELKKRLPDGEKTPDQIQDQRRGGLVCVLPAVQCASREHLNRLMQQVITKGGEGLMLREPRSPYMVGRNHTLYKYKFWYDAEGLVIGHEKGQGEHLGLMGSVRIQMESGRTLTVGSGFSVAQRRAFFPHVGMVIRYKFQELSHDGTPRFPIYEGVCPDKTGPKDADVRSTKYRADARKDELNRFFKSLDAQLTPSGPAHESA